jgi:DNA-binding protein WhiA
VYLKGSDEIALLLKLIGASKAVLRFENFRIMRESRGRANRVANADTGNLRRSVATGLRQAAAVRGLAGAGLLEVQPQAIREVAALRLAMPSATLEQMAARLHLSKSAVNQRLRRLVEVASGEGVIDSISGVA